MKLKLFIAFLISAGPSAAFAQTPAFSFCGTYGAYVMLYKNTDQFEELGKLRCGERVEVLGRWFDYLEVRTLDGKVGWVRSADVSGGPAASPSATPFGLTNSPVQAPREVAVPLSNKNIVSMQAIRLSPEVIIAKIKSSPTSFDTSADGLQKLKRAGIPNEIILAMVEAPTAAGSVAPVPDTPKAPEVTQVKVPDGTPVEVEMIASVSSDAVREGTIVHLKVVKDVAVNGVIVFQKDSEARARVYVITQPAFLGKPGQISWAMEDITAVNGDRLPATFAAREPNVTNSSTGNVDDTGTIWEFRKNKPATMAAGHCLRVTIHGDIVLKIPAVVATQSSQGNSGSEIATRGSSQVSLEVPSEVSRSGDQKH
jgi:hypothetical protein